MSDETFVGRVCRVKLSYASVRCATPLLPFECCMRAMCQVCRERNDQTEHLPFHDRLAMLDEMLKKGIESAPWLQFDEVDMTLTEYGYRYAMDIVAEWQAMVSATCPGDEQ